MGLAKVAAPLPTRVNIMASYIVATVRITDPERFAVYGKAVAGLAERFGGEALLKGAVSEVLEGAAKPVGSDAEGVIELKDQQQSDTSVIEVAAKPTRRRASKATPRRATTR